MVIHVRAPGRVNIIAEHTDYTDGFVLPMAIDLGVEITGEPSDERSLIVTSREEASTIELSTDADPRGDGSWRDYFAGVVRALRESGEVVPGARIEIRSSLPIGAGLSSSAALLVGTLYLLHELQGRTIDRTALARLAQRAEFLGTGARTGIMDQFVIANGRAGRAVLLDCRSLEETLVRLPSSASFLVVDSGVRHSVATSEYNVRRQECEAAAAALGVAALRDAGDGDRAKIEGLEEPLRSRALHVVQENERVLAASRAFEDADLALAGRLMSASHRSLRDLYEVSVPELDEIVDVAERTPGVHGARMTGAGFGGCVVVLIDAQRAGSVREHLLSSLRKRRGVDLRSWNVRASDGVEVIA
ncbi:MAG: galactokinase [Candidatus Eremiobacteraeota bacterium]|nr:galactokinase [Candidatus Eremiobacteraeota bacterium]